MENTSADSVKLTKYFEEIWKTGTRRTTHAAASVKTYSLDFNEKRKNKLMQAFLTLNAFDNPKLAWRFGISSWKVKSGFLGCVDMIV